MAKSIVIAAAVVLLTAYVASGQALLGSRGSNSSIPGNSVDHNNTETKNDTKLCITCAMYCEFGYVMDSNGCPSCTCIRPCENVTCSAGKKCKETPSLMCGSEACPNATYTGECVIDKNDACGKCAEQCPYGFNKDGSSCSTCKCVEPCTGVNCYAGRKCQAIAIDICNDKPCANTTYLGLCVPTANECPVPCLNFCEFGFVTGSNGCPTCECAHPCKNYTCEFGKKCKEVADSWCGNVACPNTTYSPSCELCTPCQKFCPYGNYIASDGCPSCDCLEPCRGFTCQEGFKCHAKPSIMCGSEACKNATYYPECIERKCATCNTICPFGYNKGADGCPNCECKEPCKNVQCNRGTVCVEIPDVMCGDQPCDNSTYHGQCVIEENECVSCAYPCPYGNVKGLDGCPTCVCVQPCLNVQCSSGLKCVAEKRPVCGNEPCANSTYTGICVDEATAGNRTENTQSMDDWEDTGLGDVTHLIQEVQVCHGYTELLSCPDDQEINILRAFYGRDSSTVCLQGASATSASLRFSLPGVTSLLKELCEGKQTCELSPDLDLFGEPQAAVSLYVKAEYLCRPRKHQTLQCSNSGRIRLECKPGTTLNIISAMYGRDDLNTTCPHPFAEVTDNCSNPRALETVQAICNGRSSCYVGADSQTFSDPCPHSNKYLRMEYECAECSNALGDDAQCQFWANQGACDKNKEWMISNCRKACTRCELELPCANAYNDTQCDSWAASNECTHNPAFMFSYCRKSCLKCDRATDCINQYNDTACDSWMRSNECAANPNFMLSICTKSCFFCSGNVKCANNYPDKDCDLWAISGECDKNPGFMVSQCYKSCFNCDKDPVCQNSGASDTQCDQWAKDDQCQKNPSFMYRYCWKSCMQCQAYQPACTNYWGDVWCEYAALQGQCSRDMMNVCYKSCSRCAPTPTVGDCLNVNNTMCAEMVRNGECTSDPAKAMRVCKRACTLCDQPTVHTSYTGGGLMPGELLDGVSGYTVLTPQPIKSFGRLAYFSAFFMSNASFYVQIWRPWYTDNFYLIHDQFVTPTATNYAQSIPVEKCVQVTAGDRIGFTTMRGAPPMATSFDPDMAAQSAYVRLGSKQDKFTPVGLSIRFSLNAHTVPGNC